MFLLTFMVLISHLIALAYPTQSLLSSYFYLISNQLFLTLPYYPYYLSLFSWQMNLENFMLFLRNSRSLLFFIFLYYYDISYCYSTYLYIPLLHCHYVNHYQIYQQIVRQMVQLHSHLF
jgi:hypothetical protein